MNNIIFENTVLPDIIQLDDIRVSYDKGKSFIIGTKEQGLNFLIEDIPEEGEFVVFLGPSGCGKSTVLRIIAGLQDSKTFTGKVLIHDKERTKDVRIGFVFQDYSSFVYYTVIKNVALPLIIRGMKEEEAEEKAMHFIKAVGLEGNEYKYTMQLSGGQKQRVAIARSLIANPGMILMDEPMSGQDTETKHQLEQLISALWTKVKSTIIMVTHDPRQAVFLGSKILMLSRKPAMIVRSFDVKLPYPRVKSLKRTPEFIHLTEEIEDAMEEINAQRPAENQDKK